MDFLRSFLKTLLIKKVNLFQKNFRRPLYQKMLIVKKKMFKDNKLWKHLVRNIEILYVFSTFVRGPL